MNFTATNKFCCIRRNSENLVENALQETFTCLVETLKCCVIWTHMTSVPTGSTEKWRATVFSTNGSNWHLHIWNKKVSLFNLVTYNMKWVIKVQVQKRSYIFILSALNENLHGVNCRKWHKQEWEWDLSEENKLLVNLEKWLQERNRTTAACVNSSLLSLKFEPEHKIIKWLLESTWCWLYIDLMNV